ncbi:ninein-like protein isoform X4 [Procambarus clarkii]|uniref:ninein-like protein isoform X4 n=1 Tax=Procambarus clarkii TaxID=6728 RepID=UPI001E670E5D|nr:ninein-like isoform X4 [Procambarus clarkii]
MSGVFTWLAGYCHNWISEYISDALYIAHGGKMSAHKSSGVTKTTEMEGSSDVVPGVEDDAENASSAVCASQVPLQDLEERLSTSGTINQDAGQSSQPNSLAYSGDNEEEYLRATWQRLGVGHDGYLSLDELATVCHAIGMEKVANEVLEQLFSRLDVDGDGRISFEEFVHMFQNGGPSGNNSLVFDESLHQDLPGAPLSRMSSVSDERRGISATEFSVFSSIDPDSTGYATVDNILELWESLNISNGVNLLKEMGFPHRSHERLSLCDLSSALEEECQITEDQGSGTSVAAVNVALLTYLHDIKYLRFSLDAARGERKKLRVDLNEANQRLTLLAQELDDHNAHMEASSQYQIQELERQYRDQVRELQEAVTHERDSAREQVSTVAREMQAQNTHLQQEESKLKSKLSSLYADIKRLEAENTELSEKLQEAEKQLSQMEKQVADMQTLKNKVAEYESMSPREEEYRRLLDRLERVTVENQHLRDNNDELLSQIDSFPMRQNNVRNSDKDSSLDGSCLGDYVDQPMGLLAPVKRRGSNSGSGDDSCEEESPRGSKVRRCSKGLNVHYVDVGSYDESFFDSSMSSLLKSSPAPSTQPLNASQPTSLDELIRVPRRSSGDSDAGESSLGIKNASQLVNKELKQVFKQVRASIKEEYKSDLHEDSGSQGLDETHKIKCERSNTSLNRSCKMTAREELEAELMQLREEKNRLARQLAMQQEEFAHKLEKKEFECEVALHQCSGVREQLEKTTTQLNSSPPETCRVNFHLASTPVKSSHSAPASLRDKCVRCGDTQGQLTVALEELEMALRREEQERMQRISVETILTNRHDLDSPAESGGADSITTTYPGSTSELSTAAKPVFLRSLHTAGEGRVRVLEEQYRGLEGELARVRVEVLKMVEERGQLCLRTNLEKQREIEFENMRKRYRSLIEKIQKKRRALAPKEDNTKEKEESCNETEQDGDTNQSRCSQLSDAACKTNYLDKDKMDGFVSELSKDDFKVLEEQVLALEEEMSQERDSLEKQRASLLEKNNKLEQDLEILRVEFDKSEDYWTLKLQEEQDYYEEERRLYDDKFSALEKKIREYEELVLSGGGGGGRENSEESDRLSTIDESAVWEKQVTELEEEVALLRKQIDDLREERRHVESKMEARVSEERQLAAHECANLQDQVNNLSSQLHQAQLQVTTVLEELDKVRRESEQRIQELANQQRLHMQVRVPLMNGHATEVEEPPSPETHENRPSYQGSGSIGEETINGSLRAQLRQCQERLRILEAALRQHHTHASQILTVTREQHAAEVQNLESMLAATQQMLGQHIAKYKDQVRNMLSKASRSDSLVKELYLENAQLMRALQITENRQKSAEETSRRLQMAALGPHTIS